MRSICTPADCTACGACENICPKQCVTRHMRDDDSWYLEIDDDQCVNCHMCDVVCPNKTSPKLNMPEKAFAVWANDPEEHRTSASGGIAAALYRYALKQGMYIAGVVLDEKYEARFVVTNQEEYIERFKNSKYTFSHMDKIFKEAAAKLREREKLFFVGLPCHVAAMKNYMQRLHCGDNLIFVDLVCHGTPPPIYFSQHIQAISSIKKRNTDIISFREPNYGTQNFCLTIYSDRAKTNVLYKKGVEEDDLYQIGYHKALIYRECCYQCHYAQHNRSGDITLGDYHGLGMLAPYTHERKEVSCVLLNTPKGMEFFEAVRTEGSVIAHERPVREPMTYEKQMNHPSVAPPKQRKIFLDEYAVKKNYDKAANIAFNAIVKQNRIRHIFNINKIKLSIIHAIPRPIKENVKAVWRKMK